MSNPIRVLYIDDNPLDRELVRDALEQEHGGFQVTEAASRAEFEQRLAEQKYDLVLSDFSILGFEGLDVLRAVQEVDPSLPVVIVTGTGSEEVAVEALRSGAADYVIKTPAHVRRLPHILRAVLDRARLAEERRRAEEALRESEEKFRTITESSADAIFITDQKGNYVYANRAASDLLGYAVDELTKMSIPDISVQGQAEESLRQFRRLLEDGSSFTEIDLVRKDGSVVPTDLNAVVLPNGMIYGSCRDLSERKRAEQELREHRDHLEEIVAERTADMRKVINSMAGREVRMAELKDVIRKLRAQLAEAGLEPVADDPLLEKQAE